MIHSLRKGTGFGGVLRYISNPDKGYLLGGSYRGEATTRDIAADMGSLAHERTSKPVFHASLSLPPGERLDDAQWLRAASHYLEGLGYSDVPFVVYRHTDREHDHIHIVASRVTYDGKIVSDSNDRQRGMALCRQIEKLYQLEAPTPRNAEPTLRQEEIHGVKNKGEEHLKAKLRAAIQQSGEGSPALSVFIERLEQRGVGVTLNQTSKGTIRGISFEIDGSAFAGSSLGRDFSWAGLQRSYGLAQDQAVLRQPPASRSPWSTEALDKLRSLLHETPVPAARIAAHALRAEGASALGDAANASALALQARPQVRFPASEEAPFPTLRRALSLTECVGDPRTALALATAETYATRRPRLAPAGAVPASVSASPAARPRPRRCPLGRVIGRGCPLCAVRPDLGDAGPRSPGGGAVALPSHFLSAGLHQGGPLRPSLPMKTPSSLSFCQRIGRAARLSLAALILLGTADLLGAVCRRFVRVNLSPSLPRGLYRPVPLPLARGRLAPVPAIPRQSSRSSRLFRAIGSRSPPPAFL